MRKKCGFFLAVAVLLLMAGYFCMCAVRAREDSGTGEGKTYVYAHEDGFGESAVTIYCDLTFVFEMHPLSSYLGVGRYESKDNALVLFTDDGQNHYTFRKESGKLIYDAERSSEIPSYCDISDGAVFE